jgi:hypothetical protein
MRQNVTPLLVLRREKCLEYLDLLEEAMEDVALWNESTH